MPSPSLSSRLGHSIASTVQQALSTGRCDRRELHGLAERRAAGTSERIEGLIRLTTAHLVKVGKLGSGEGMGF